MKCPIFLAFFITSSLASVPIEHFFPFGTTSNDSLLPRSDDGSSAPQNLAVQFPFFDKLFPQLWINVNGGISFLSAIATFTPTCAPVAQKFSMISPFWADIDTRDRGNNDAIYFRESQSAKDLQQAEAEIAVAFPSLFGIKLKSTFIVTWFNVTYFRAELHPFASRNTFQATIATDGIYSFAIFYYNQISWISGDASKGIAAQAGFDAGDGKNRLMLDGSCQSSISTIQNRSNVNSPGKWIFRVDSENIQTAGCSSDFVPKNALTISPAIVTTLGQVALEVSGPCIKATNTSVICRIFDPASPGGPFIPGKGKIIGSSFDSSKILCEIPFLFSAGKMKLEISISDDNAPISLTNRTFHGYFYAENLKPEGNGLSLKFDKIENATKFTWSPNSFTNSTNFLTLQAIIFDLNQSSTLKNVIKIVDKIPNNGEWTWAKNESTIKICENLNIQITFQLIEFGWDLMEGVDYHDHWIANAGVDVFQFIGDYCEPEIREIACNNWFSTAENTTSISLPCPPTADQAKVDLRLRLLSSSEASFFHSGEDACYEAMAPLENGEDQKCCYKNGNIDCRFSGGNSQLSHGTNSFGHYANDIFPWIMCCYNQDDAICGQFQSKRLCNSGIDYSPPGAAMAFGDPHFQTFDGLFYTFNGFGEFWILQNSSQQPLAIQARMEPLTPTTTDATILSGFVFSMPNSPKLQIQKSAIRIVDIFVDDLQIDITSPNSLKKLSVNGWNFEISENFETIEIGFGIGFAFEISTKNGVFGIFGMASPQWKGKTLGLLGNFNGNKDDDLTNSNGTAISPTSNLSDIHFKFGMSWEVTPETSHFTYFGGKRFQDFNNPKYTPTFSFDPSTISNAIQKFCNNDISCMFDYNFLQNQEAANATRFLNLQYQNAVAILNKTTQMCPFLMAPENGFLIFSNFLKDSEAQFGCFQNFTLSRNLSFTCGNNFQWSSDIGNTVTCIDNFANHNSSPSFHACNFVIIFVNLIFYCLHEI